MNAREMLKRCLPRPLRQVIVGIRNVLRGEINSSEVIPALLKLYCTGNGLEIGPGKNPRCDRKRTKFLDKHSTGKDGCPNPDILAPADRIPVPDGTFDYVFSSHCLEHMPNTIRVLREWIRVLRPAGVLFLVLPHGDRTLDRCRKKTTLDHHIHDLTMVGDASFDPSHFGEMQQGWTEEAGAQFEQRKADYEREWGAPIWDFEFRIKNDILHYHVWTQDEIVVLLKYMDLTIMHVCELVPDLPNSFLVVARTRPDAKDRSADATS